MSTPTGNSLGPGFRALFQGVLVSNAGDGIRLTALPLLAASLTDSPLLIATVTAAQYLPWLVFAPLGGALVDRWPRRRTILTTQAWRGVVIAALVIVVATSQAQIWHLCIVAFAITAGEILVDPSTVALVPTLVADDDLDRANGRISSAEIITNDFAGGPIGAALFSLAPWLPFVFDSFTYLGSLLPFRKLPREPDQSSGSRAQSLKAEAAEGFRFLRRHRVLGPLTIATVVYFFGLATSLSLLVVLVKDELQGSTGAFGLVIAAAAIGAFAGTFIGSPLAARLGPRTSISGLVALQAITLAIAAAASSVPALAVTLFVNAIPAGAQRPITRSLQQRLTPNELLGRVNVTSRIFTRGIIVAGALGSGAIAARSGVRLSFALAGAVQLVAAAMMWLALGRSEHPQP